MGILKIQFLPFPERSPRGFRLLKEEYLGQIICLRFPELSAYIGSPRHIKALPRDNMSFEEQNTRQRLRSTSRYLNQESQIRSLPFPRQCSRGFYLLIAKTMGKD